MKKLTPRKTDWWMRSALELRLSLYSDRDKGWLRFASHDESFPKLVSG